MDKTECVARGLGNLRLLVIGEAPAPDRMRTYIKKYADGIKSLDMTIAEIRERHTVPILVALQVLRGFVE